MHTQLFSSLDRLSFGLILMFLLGLLGAPLPSWAGPVVAVDTDLLTAGVQPSLTADVGDILTIAITITGVEATHPLQSFEFDLLFNPAVLQATSVSDGGFLPTGIFGPPFVVENDVTAPDVNFAVTTLDFSGSIGDGILASITFEALGPGVSELRLENVLLSEAFGIAILPDSINIGTATIRGPVTAVPEPGATQLLLLGIIAVSGWRWQARRHRCRRGGA